MRRAILRAASWLVPAARRVEWLAEWRAELWHVERVSRRRAAVFAMGAFHDALWLRSEDTPLAAPDLLTSPARCLALLALFAGAAALVAQRMPAPQVPADLVTISADGRFDARYPTVPYDAYRTIAARTPRPYSAIAFCEPVRAGGLTIAHVTPAIFDVLDVLTVIPARRPALILTDRALQRQFGATIEVDGRRYPIAGVVKASSWPLSARIDGWLVDDRIDPSAGKGFVLAKWKVRTDKERWWIYAANAEGRWSRFECVRSAGRHFWPALLTLAIVFALLPAVTSLRLGEFPRRGKRFRRWAFLGLKVGLLFAGVWNLAAMAGGVQPVVLIVGNVAALRWAVVDQRRRCPVCLRVLACPTPIGCPSHAFLEWYGTELLCLKGHGMLHVPEIPTSCYSAPRWMALDPSWSSLFS